MTRHSRIITIATTNDSRLVDDAVLRAARFDQVVELSLPDALQRAEILSLYLRHVEHSVDVKECARRTDGFSGDDLREVVRAALLDAQDDVITESELETAISRRRAVVEDERPGGLHR